eukprot:CAMPEP_0172552854 /NCGR_PEP_ID=MMETSP1067-20121228/47233_1 /TAXON_ID=265564 ORGANISM="Thalassiosira punctigera, Strain Tpunct2005C2" /NCGR_SAMPLE_ID=MMETSP1067 /ASSEMBLY_ACC=CAM_ASM_000444 /LENGTH=588 /DNA_ID=CAMNT_0013340923 /DNA_START=48 /DNA_END=1814 /DNA_ORIENTATION=+
MAADKIKKYYPYPRRKSHISAATCSNNAMIALLLMTVPTTVQPFLMPPPLPSAALSSSRVCPSMDALPSIPSGNIHQVKKYGRRRHILHSSNPNDSDAEDDGNPKEIDMPSDDALFRNSIDGTESESTNDDLTRSDSNLIYGEDDDDDDDEDDDPYAQTAPSEFRENEDTVISPSTSTSLATAIARQSRELNTSPLDWGGALSTLRSRVSDIESGKSTDPSTALFRTATRERPNEAIGRFVREADPQVVAAMTGAVSSLLGSLSNPAMGVETIVQASSEKLGNLCFQLMMTGYMFRNAEYVLALKSLMNIEGEGTTLAEYRAAFQRIDTDGSGYLEREEIEALLADVYEGKPPAFEITTFLEFFDSNNDGRVSWEEFEKGFAVVTRMGESENGGEQNLNKGFSLPGSVEEDDSEEDMFGEPAVSGTIQVELEDGKVIEVDAQEYINDLKQQALELKRELAQEKGIDPSKLGIADKSNDAAAGGNPFINEASPGPGSSGGIASYISSLRGDVKSLTQGISPEVVDSMKKLIDFVLEGGPEGGGNAKAMEKKKEMELPGSALQQLALWQLVIGYRLRETEATGEWRKMLE